MNKFILVFLSITFSTSLTLCSQEQIDWVEMMKDGNMTLAEISSLHDAYWEGKEITAGCGWKPFKRWEALMQTRLNEDGYIIPQNQYLKAYQLMRQHSSMRSPAGNWQSLGPILNDETTREEIRGVGRVNCMAFHPTDPNIIFVGTPAGGLWRSYDGGNWWETNTDNLPTLGVSTIVFHPNNPEIVYMGTGDRDHNDNPGMGVMKSTDGGLTWEFKNVGIQNKSVGVMLINPNNPDVLLVGTNDGIFRSNNAGNSWYYVSLNSLDYRDMKFKPGDPETVYATGGGKFYKSVDGGQTWDWVNGSIQSTARMVIGVTPANPEIVYVCGATTYEFHKFYKSNNSGESFTVMSFGPNILGWAADGSGDGGQAWYDFCMAADPVDTNVVYVGGVRMKKSTDGGTTWEDINSNFLHVDQHDCYFSPHNHDLYLANDGGFYRYENNSVWKDISRGIVNGQIYKFGQSPHTGAKALTGFQDNGTAEFLGSGWIKRGGGDGFEAWYDPTDENWFYGSLYYGRIYRTSPWFINQQICGLDINGIDEEGAWVTPFVLSETNANVMYVGLKNVWRTTSVKHALMDSVVWQKISTNLGGNNANNMTILEIHEANENILFGSEGNRKLFMCTNALDEEPVWIDKSFDLPPFNLPVTAIETNPYADSVLYIGFNNKVYKSSDTANTWVEWGTGLPDLPVNTMVYDKSSDEGLYVGTDLGIFYKDASMDTWIPFSQGFPMAAKVTELEIFEADPLSERRIRASTFGRGLWESDLFDSETYSFPATAHFTDGTAVQEVYADFTLQIGFYKNMGNVPVTDFSFEDVFVENANAVSLLQNPDGETYELSVAVDQYGPIKVYVEDFAATDLEGLASAHSDTLLLVYNPEPEPFGYQGPGGVGDTNTIPVWFRADKGVFTSGIATQPGETLDTWANQGSGPDAIQSETARNPQLVSGTEGINTLPAVHFDGEDDYLIAEGVYPGANLSVFSVVDSDETDFNTYGWIASARQQNGFVLHPWEGEPFYSPLVFDGSGGFVEGSKLYIGDAAAPHIYGFIFEQSEYFQLFHTIFDENRLNNPSSLGLRNETGQINIKYGWDIAERYGAGMLAEHFIYNRRLYETHRILVSNYLASKYGMDLGNVKRYFHESRNLDLAGIGQESAYDKHWDAKGTGIVRMYGAADLEDGEYLMWGRDDQPYEWTNEGFPILSERLATTWGFDETGDVGAVTVRIDLADLPETTNNIGLIVSNLQSFTPGELVDFYPLTVEGDHWVAAVDFPNSGVFTIGVEPSIGVEDLARAKVNIFPNPSTELFYLTFENTSIQKFDLKVLDARGRIIWSDQVLGSNGIINAQDWLSGVYMLKITGGKQQRFVRLIKG